MKRICHSLLAALLAALAFSGVAAADDSAAPPVALRPSAALAPGQDAFPRLAESPGHPAALRINRALARLEARFRAAAASCRDGEGSVSRAVAVTMRGPRYLSLVATDEWNCGAHPSVSVLALVYDAKTGAPVDWRKLLPPPLVEKTTTDAAGDGTVIGLVVSRKLSELYRRAALATDIPRDCADVLAEGERHFALWPAAREDGIALQPADLPHAVAVCGPAIVIPAATLRPLGASRTLLEDIGKAHQSGWYGAP